MEFQAIYSRKIQGAVMLFTVFMFACQYGLTRETVAENFSRTGICWSEFALNVVFSILLIFLVWDDDYILSDESITFRRVVFCKKHKEQRSTIALFFALSYIRNSSVWSTLQDCICFLFRSISVIYRIITVIFRII